MASPFYLITETSLHASYLVNAWLQTFESLPNFKGIVVREDRQSRAFYEQREAFHQHYQGCHELSAAVREQMYAVYPHASETDLAMIRLFGIPAHSVTVSVNTIVLGHNLNSKGAWRWLSENVKGEIPFLFIFLDQLLDSWWIEMTRHRIINGHSAVLPYARGMYAIENIAIRQDRTFFVRAAGATIHFIDAGIDTGPLLKTRHLADPFGFNSIWEVKAASFEQVFQLLIEIAHTCLTSSEGVISGTPYREAYGPNFNSRTFTAEARQKAAEGYLSMKAAGI